MLDAGLNVTINSDDPPMFATSLTDEYRWLARQGVAWDRLHTCTLAAVDASFASPEEKAALRQRIQET
jgi:adenosine deaminase